MIKEILCICRQDGGKYFLFYLEDEQKWIDSRHFYGSTLFNKLENNMDGYCLEEHNNWSLFNMSTFIPMFAAQKSKFHLLIQIT